jgi:hypothetical protein
MPRDATLARIRAEIEAGDLGSARDRLHGLISSYPGDLRLRRELGEVYWALGDRAMAGRHWYLVVEKSPVMEEAVKAFERSCGGNAGHMLRSLKLLADPATLDPPAAGAIYEELRIRAGAAPWRRRDGDRSGEGKGMPLQSTIIQYGCMVLLVAVALFAVIGLVTVLDSLR